MLTYRKTSGAAPHPPPGRAQTSCRAESSVEPGNCQGGWEPLRAHNPGRGGSTPPPDSTRPTPAQLRVLLALEHFAAVRGYAPTLRELCRELGVRSTYGVAEHLEHLRSKGLVEGRGRALRVVRRAA